MSELASPVVQRRQLAIALRDARVQSGVTINEAADHLICSAAKISRMETGQRSASQRDVRDLCALYKVSDDERDRLMDLARDSRRRGWWETHSLTPVYATYVGLEEVAVSIQDFKSSIVPGLLQTADYANAVVTGFFAQPDPIIVNRLVRTRMERQAMLFERDKPPLVHAVMDEAAIRRIVGSPEIMAEQLDRLVTEAESPNNTIQIVPFAAGAHAGVETTFSILAFAEPTVPTAAFSEDVFGMMQLYPDDLARSAQIFSQVAGAALPPPESIELIRKIQDELENAADSTQ